VGELKAMYPKGQQNYVNLCDVSLVVYAVIMTEFLYHGKQQCK